MMVGWALKMGMIQWGLGDKNKEIAEPPKYQKNSYSFSRISGMDHLLRRVNFLVILSLIQWSSHHSMGLTKIPLTIIEK